MTRFLRLLILVSMAWGLQVLALEKTYQVQGMHCGGCSQTIESAFMKNSAVKSCKADFKTGNLKIEFKEGQSLDQRAVAKILEDAGYSLVEGKK